MRERTYMDELNRQICYRHRDDEEGIIAFLLDMGPKKRVGGHGRQIKQMLLFPEQGSRCQSSFHLSHFET